VFKVARSGHKRDYSCLGQRSAQFYENWLGPGAAVETVSCAAGPSDSAGSVGPGAFLALVEKRQGPGL
jgi:hypothetical protein